MTAPLLVSLGALILSAAGFVWSIYMGRRSLDIQVGAANVSAQQGRMAQRMDAIEEASKVIELKDKVIELQSDQIAECKTAIARLQNRIDQLVLALKQAGIGIPEETPHA